MTQQRTLVYAAASIPFLVMGLILGFVMLFGAGAQSAAVTSGCATSALAAGQPPLIQYYLDASARYGLGTDGFAYLAAINRVETSFGTNLAVSTAGAVGWMQFQPATWSQYAVSVTDPAAPASPEDPQDAIYTAAHYLSASGAPADWGRAIYAYNHSTAYVNEVQVLAARYSGPNGISDLQADIQAAWGTSQQPTSDTPAEQAPATTTGSVLAGAVQTGTCVSTVLVDDVTPVNGSEAVIMPNGLARPGANAPAAVQAMVDAGDRITSFPYSYGGGHCSAAMNQTAPDPDACPGEQENGSAGFDCSSSTSYVLWGGGYSSLLENQPQVSGNFASLGAAGVDPAGWVTWWATAGHVFIEVDGLVMDTVHGPTTIAPHGAPATGPRWQASSEVQWELTNDTGTGAGAFVPRHLENL